MKIRALYEGNIKEDYIFCTTITLSGNNLCAVVKIHQYEKEIVAKRSELRRRNDFQRSVTSKRCRRISAGGSFSRKRAYVESVSIRNMNVCNTKIIIDGLDNEIDIITNKNSGSPSSTAKIKRTDLKKNRIFLRLFRHLKNNAWFYGEIVGLVGAAVLQWMQK